MLEPSSSSSLGPSLLFSHPSARLVKSIPPLPPPPRVNGRVPADQTGAGRLATSDVILSDSFGPLTISTVPDPFNPTISTLVLSIGFDEHQHGAARRFVLPFRSFDVGPNAANAFNTATRITYAGLGAGRQGLDGGSFWFFEDIGEAGALDRQRWEADGVGKRAIWTLWILSSPAPVVEYIRNLLTIFPAPIPSLPPFLSDPSNHPWRDNYARIVSLSASATKPRPLPPLPHKPENLRGVPSSTSPEILPRLASRPQHVELSKAGEPVRETDLFRTISKEQPLLPPSSPGEAALEEYDRIRERTDEINSSVGVAPLLQAPAFDGSINDPFRPSESGTNPRNGSRRNLGRRPPSHFRHSLVAVDNETGEILGVLASDVHLEDGQAARIESPKTPSSEDGEDGPRTPSDEKDLPSLAGSNDVTPRPSRIKKSTAKAKAAGGTLTDAIQDPPVLRPASVYRDLDHGRQPSRTESVLGADTFAPPPPPPKQSSGKDVYDSPSARTSVASAMFFSAPEYEDDSDTDSGAWPKLTEGALANFISVRGHEHVESHRPELLRGGARGGSRAEDEEEDARSDASGSTVGGPALRLWRKARGKRRRKSGGQVKGDEEGLATRTDAAPIANMANIAPRQQRKGVSERSDRTSKAETAATSFSDLESGEEVEEEGEEEKGGMKEQAAKDEAPPPPLPTKTGSHPSRRQLRTDEIRTIEDKVWREALDSGSLPIDAPYTHLAARGVGRRRNDIGVEVQEFELLRPGEKVVAKGIGSGRQIGGTKDVVSNPYMQDSDHEATTANNHRTDPLGTSSDKAGARMLSLVPVLPSHLLWFLGIANESNSHPSSAPNGLYSSLEAASAGGNAILSSISNLWLGIGESASSLYETVFGLSTTTTSSSSSVDGSEEDPKEQSSSSKGRDGNKEVEDEEEDEERDSKAEEWEYAIPEFDPNSLASTPRPVYRRKRPVPCFKGGFNFARGTGGGSSTPTSQNGESKESSSSSSKREDDPHRRPTRAQVQREEYGGGDSSSIRGLMNASRYSIVHIDGNGVGRRTFFKGLAGHQGLAF
ncbi:hypothetical protein IE53DRAFT_161785 [Violaceomyces palustris]|uniref:Uncharacterized protein n=1 Tax=Violaceomyces palustris TaxID=1673888 RepID=A0ACD0NTK8_9BASI|nr:hypothetical protein IE53DRAFT_161785 [Violaceomyces palustris]